MGSCGCGPKGGGFSCCNKKEFVQDKLCCNFTLTGTAATTVYQTNVSVCSLVASGFIKFCGPANSTVTVRFLRGGTPVTTPIVISEGSCVNFTVSRFDTITVTGTSATATAPIEGEICLTPRYALPH